MELLQLRYFYEAARHESITKAARHYQVPPSSVSLSIKRLETELGCELFDRSSNQIRLNQNGRRLQNALSGALQQLDEAVEALSDSPSQLTGDIYLLLRCSRRMLIDKIQAFREAHPGVTFHISHNYTTENIADFDIIVDAASDYRGFSGEAILAEPIRLAVSEKSPLCGQTLRLEDLRNQPFVSMYQGNSMHRITQDCCRRAGFEPNIIIETDDPTYLREYVRLGYGIAFFPTVSWAGLMNGCSYLDITGLREQRVIYAYRNQFRRLQPVAATFYETLLQGLTP